MNEKFKISFETLFSITYMQIGKNKGKIDFTLWELIVARIQI